MAFENQFRDILQGIQDEAQKAALNGLPDEVKERIAAGYLTADERAERDRRYGLLGEWAKFEKDLLPRYKEAFTQQQTLQGQLTESQGRIAQMESELTTLRASSAAGEGDPAKLADSLKAIRDDIKKELQSQFVTQDQLAKAKQEAQDASVEFIHTRSIPVMRRADDLVLEAREKYSHSLDRERLFETAKANGNNLDLAYRIIMDPVREAFQKSQHEKDLKDAEERGHQAAINNIETKGHNPEDSSGGNSFRGFVNPGNPPAEVDKIPDSYVPGQGDLLGRAAAADYKKLMESGTVQ